MFTVNYEHQLEYAYDRKGKRFPRLTFRILDPEDSTRAVDAEAHLDSGTEKSLFDGWIGAALGIDILRGRQIMYESASGSSLPATMHPVRLVHDDLGAFDLEVGFSSSKITRNLLGRDFFDLSQIGFREHQLSFFITSIP